MQQLRSRLNMPHQHLDQIGAHAIKETRKLRLKHYTRKFVVLLPIKVSTSLLLYNN